MGKKVNGMLKNAEKSLDQAKEAFKEFNDKTKPLDDLIERLKGNVAFISMGIKRATPKVDEAEKYVEDLKQQAKKLSEPLKNTKAQSEADKALRAANVYKNIVKAIMDALEAA